LSPSNSGLTEARRGNIRPAGHVSAREEKIFSFITVFFDWNLAREAPKKEQLWHTDKNSCPPLEQGNTPIWRMGAMGPGFNLIKLLGAYLGA
jgi:hypothetical protein